METQMCAAPHRPWNDWSRYEAIVYFIYISYTQTSAETIKTTPACFLSSHVIYVEPRKIAHTKTQNITHRNASCSSDQPQPRHNLDRRHVAHDQHHTQTARKPHFLCSAKCLPVVPCIDNTHTHTNTHKNTSFFVLWTLWHHQVSRANALRSVLCGVTLRSRRLLSCAMRNQLLSCTTLVWKCVTDAESWINRILYCMYLVIIIVWLTLHINRHFLCESLEQWTYERLL